MMEFIDSLFYYQAVVPLIRRALDLGFGNSNTTAMIESGDMLNKFRDVRFCGNFYWSEDQSQAVRLVAVCHELAEKFKLEVSCPLSRLASFILLLKCVI